METVECYKTSDGVLHESENAAILWEDDLIGAQFGELIKCLNLDLGHSGTMRATMDLLIKRKELLTILVPLVNMLQYSENDESKGWRLSRMKKQFPHFVEYLKATHG